MASLKRPRVLIAEDHPGVAKAVCRMLALECDIVGHVADGRMFRPWSGEAAHHLCNITIREFMP